MSPDAFAAELGLSPSHEPPGSLRVLSRNDGSEIQLLVDQSRAIGDGERLAHVEWYENATAAAGVAAQCTRLLIAAGVPGDVGHWHRFAVEHLKTLLATAKTCLEVKPVTLSRRPAAAAWSRERVARLGFLVGLGWTAKRIAGDPMIASTPNNVYRQAHRFGLLLTEAPRGRCAIQISLSASAVYERAAARHGITPEALMRRVLMATAIAPQRVEEAAGPL